MAKKKTCCECGKPLTKDEVALTRNLRMLIQTNSTALLALQNISAVKQKT